MLGLYAGLDFVTLNYGTTSLLHHTKIYVTAASFHFLSNNEGI